MRNLIEPLESRQFLAAQPISIKGSVVAASLPLKAAAVHAKAAAPTVADASAVLSAVASSDDVVGIVGGVIKDGVLVATGAAGKRKATAKKDVAVSDSFYIGSAGKAMTATLVARLVDAGKLSWTTTIGQALPTEASSAYADVTIEQLLAHRSGISDALVSTGNLSGVFTSRGSTRNLRNTYAHYALSFPPAGTPGTSFSYSNVGYIVAAAMVEKVMNGAYEALMSKWVFKPLGMKSAKFGYPANVSGHTADGTPTAAGKLLPAVSNPAGRISMNVADWSKFLISQMGYQVSGQDFLKPETLTYLQTPLSGSTSFEVGFQPYAKGWVVINNPLTNQTTLYHLGTDDLSFTASVTLNRSTNTAVFVAVNQVGATTALTDATAALTTDYLG